MLLSWIFISPYTTTYFFVKKFIFSNVYISVNMVFKCLSFSEYDIRMSYFSEYNIRMFFGLILCSLVGKEAIN